LSKIKKPTEKKELSYAHDRRNAFGESTHAARKAIPRAKARTHRAERHQVHQAMHLTELAVLTDGEVAEDAETALAEAKLQRLHGFKKIPDAPLGEIVAKKIQKRISRVGRHVAAAKIKAVKAAKATKATKAKPATKKK
jgi:hypothetical protein